MREGVVRGARALIGAGIWALATLVRADAGDAAPNLAPMPELDPYDTAISYPELEVFAPRMLPGAKRAQDRSPEDSQAAAPGMLQGGRLPAWPRLYRDERLAITGSVIGTAAGFKMWNNLFAPPPALQTPGVPVDPGWGEFFLEAGLSARLTMTDGMALYGGVSYLESGTRGRDYDGNANVDHGDTELLYAGATWTIGAASVDVSYGQQEFTLGDGMLIWSGATNGTQRGAAYVGPRAAWARAAIAKLTVRDLTVQLFGLAPNEAPDENTDTRIEGVNLEWMPTGPLRIGGTYLHVPRSAIVTRDGLDVMDLRVRWHPLRAVPELWLQGEYADERGSNVRASGWYAQVNYSAKSLPWKPLVSLQWSHQSGDDPGTSRWEGFDPLYFGNGNPNWYPGKVVSTFLQNTNVAIASANLTLTPSERHVVELWWLNFRAVVANAPPDIPAANSPPPQGGGVPAKPLATEVDLSWTIKFGKAVNLNLLAGWAMPGEGYKAPYETAGGRASAWWLVGAQFNVSY